MIASHLALLLALSLILVVALLVMAFAAVPAAMAVGSLALALGARFHLPTVPGRHESGTRRPTSRWATIPTLPGEFGGLRWTQAWPTVPPRSQIPVVREEAAAVLAEWDVCGEAAEPALLVVTELLTNALEYACTPIQITLELDHTFVRVQVHDGATEPPQPRRHGPTQTRGHGLEIVAALAVRQGWTPDPYGKTVWADVPTHWPR